MLIAAGFSGRVARAHQDVARAKACEMGAYAAFGQMQVEAILDHLSQIDASPAHHVVPGQARPG